MIKEVFAKLENAHLLSNSTVFILADHGELFGDDGRWSHGGELHEKLLEIPLLVYDRQMPLKNKEGATLLDIGPSIAERIGQPIPDCWQGFSLFSPPRDFQVKVFSDDENIVNPHGLIIKKDSSYTFQVLNKDNIPVHTRQKTRNGWVNKNNELSQKNN